MIGLKSNYLSIGSYKWNKKYWRKTFWNKDHVLGLRITAESKFPGAPDGWLEILFAVNGCENLCVYGFHGKILKVIRL